MASDEKKKRNEQTDYSDRDIIETGTSEDDGVEEFLMDDAMTLESILAEYKGSAYIDGDKRTPSTVLQAKTDKIIRESVTGRFEEDAPDNARAQPEKAVKPAAAPNHQASATGRIPKTDTGRLPKKETGRLPKQDTGALKKASTKKLPKLNGNTARLPDIDAVNMAKSLEYRTAKAGADDTDANKKDAPGDIIAFDSYDGEQDAAEEEIVREVTKAIEQQTQFEQETRKTAGKAFSLFHRKGEDTFDEAFDSGYEEAYEDAYEEPPAVFEDKYVPEPDFNIAIKNFAEKCNRYSTRCFISLSLSVLLTILTLVFQSNANLPFGIGQNMAVCTGILLVLLFITMMFSAEKLADGFMDIIKGRPGIETLNLFSCLATASAAFYSMMTRDTMVGMPFCAVSAFSLTFTLWGERVYYRALTETLRTAQATTMPTGVVVSMCEDIERSVIKKIVGKTDGFYNNLIQADVSEMAFLYAAPVLIIAAVVLGFFSSFGQDQSQYFIHNFAAIMAAAAPFPAILAYAAPFNAVAKRTRQSGAAVAGWGGADELFHSDGASIKDEDMFPEGTVSLGGIKIFDEVAPEKAIRYTASLIIASQSVLATLFERLLSKQGLSKLRVDEFSCYEGGIGGEIRGERIVTGSAALMNLQGIRVPASLNMKNGVFTAVDKKLIAVFTIDYVPVKSVQNALVSVLRHHVKLLFSVRDFNISPVMLEQKFKVPVDDVEYIPIQDTYDISDDLKLDTRRTAAVLTREGMGPYVEAIIGGRRLRLTSLVATILTLMTAVGGMVIMYTICMTGAFSAGSPGNLLLYMISMTVMVLIVCGFARYRQ